MTADFSEVRWRKSSFSVHDDCIEVAFTDDGVAVRHSRRPADLILLFTRNEWRAFVCGVRAGEFTLPD